MKVFIFILDNYFIATQIFNLPDYQTTDFHCVAKDISLDTVPNNRFIGAFLESSGWKGQGVPFR